jgi:hypothetical protein
MRTTEKLEISFAPLGIFFASSYVLVGYLMSDMLKHEHGAYYVTADCLVMFTSLMTFFWQYHQYQASKPVRMSTPVKSREDIELLQLGV